ncbi:hypothetical protein FACUT_9213 [Fusarium acutatum]|uniref:Xylanolytic transcriptional activator regulatory domain-containing protein n=1 Tax=Fusarium acutatum TaxID=78861 RepID=A0A8H4JHT2_9HYPO|nr:hypothetical protein FACUT_9213 [Fusarium acutatum]
MLSLDLSTQYGPLPNWLTTSTILFFILVPVTIALKNYLRLKHVPGPFLAQLTEFWLMRKIWKGESWAEIELKLHQDYGDVVRWGPRNVLFSDPAVIPAIYGTKNVFNKLTDFGFIQAKSYDPATTMVNGKIVESFTTTRDESRVHAIKRHINSAFTPSAMSKYESHVDESIRMVTQRISEQTPKVDLVRWMELFAFDTMVRVAFSDGNFTEDKVHDTIDGVKQRFEHWVQWYAVPNLEKLLFKNPFIRDRTTSSLLTERAFNVVRERDAMGGVGSHSDLLETYMRANQKDPEIFDRGTVVGMVMSTIHAGAETVASTLLDTFRSLLENPATMATLKKELEDAHLESPPTLQSVAKLPYLEAALKESMRLNSVNVAPMEREVPTGGAHIGGIYIPGGTAVSINTRGMARKEDVWGPEPTQFRPERWLEADAVQKSKMERAFPGFGYGKRMCIGQHIAWVEMKKMLPELLLNYNSGAASARPRCESAPETTQKNGMLKMLHPLQMNGQITPVTDSVINETSTDLSVNAMVAAQAFESQVSSYFLGNSLDALDASDFNSNLDWLFDHLSGDESTDFGALFSEGVHDSPPVPLAEATGCQNPRSSLNADCHLMENSNTPSIQSADDLDLPYPRPQDSCGADDPWPMEWHSEKSQRIVDLPNLGCDEDDNPNLYPRFFPNWSLQPSIIHALTDHLRLPARRSPWQPSNLDRFPDKEKLEYCIDMYFAHFHQMFPFIHQPTFDPAKDLTITLAIASVGALYTQLSEAAAFSNALSELNRRLLLFLEYDASVSYLHNNRPFLSIGEIHLALPCIANYWNAESAHSWAAMLPSTVSEPMSPRLETILRTFFDQTQKPNEKVQDERHRSLVATTLCRMIWTLKEMRSSPIVDLIPHGPENTNTTTDLVRAADKLARCPQNLVISLTTTELAPAMHTLQVTYVCHLYGAGGLMNWLYPLLRDDLQAATIFNTLGLWAKQNAEVAREAACFSARILAIARIFPSASPNEPSMIFHAGTVLYFLAKVLPTHFVKATAAVWLDQLSPGDEGPSAAQVANAKSNGEPAPKADDCFKGPLIYEPRD